MRVLAVVLGVALLAGLSWSQEKKEGADRASAGGTVAEIGKDGLLYITASGAPPGTVLELFKPGDPIKVGDEVVGYTEGPLIGTATVVRVQNEKLLVAQTERLEPGKTVAKGDLAYPQVKPGDEGKPAPTPAAVVEPAQGGAKSGVDALLNAPVNLDYVEAAAKRQYEKVTRRGQQLEYVLASGDTARVEEAGRIVVTSTQSMLESGQYERLDNGLAEVIDTVASVAADAPQGDRIAVRYLSSRYYAEQPGILHRLQMSWAKGQPAVRQEMVLKVPDCHLLEGEALTFLAATGGWSAPIVELRGKGVFADRPCGKLLRARLPVDSLTFGEHALLVGPSTGIGMAGAAIGDMLVELVLVTDPTEERFAVTGNGADAVKAQVNLLIKDLK